MDYITSKSLSENILYIILFVAFHHFPSCNYMFLYFHLLQSLNSIEGLHLTADNIQYHATFIDSSVSVQGREINIGPGSADYEKLLEVPIGHIDPHASIIITVGLNTTGPNTPGEDSDLIVGVFDGVNKNVWGILGKNNYVTLSPCFICTSMDLVRRYKKEVTLILDDSMHS